MKHRLINAYELGEYLGKSWEAVYIIISRRQIPFGRIGRFKKTASSILSEYVKNRGHAIGRT